MQDWWRGSVTYQVYPRSFQDSDGNGIGDLPGITRRLEHIAALGCDAVWLSPIFTSPMADMGYDVSDYTDIDPLFGTLADFEILLTRAHELGLKVIIDQVLNHSSSQHTFFKESRASRDNPKSDWYVWADPHPDGTPPNNWLSVFGGSAWEWDSRRRQYYLHNFLPSQPDFNFHNHDVQDWLLGTMRFWLDRGVDGFRLDTVNYYFHDALLRSNPPEPRNDPEPAVNPYDMQDQLYSKTQPENIRFLQRARMLLDEYDDRAMVGEIGEGRRAVKVMAEYTKGHDRLHMAYSFDLLGPQFTPEHFRSRIEGFFKGAPDGWPCWAFSNHDVVRHVTRWAEHGEQNNLARLAAAMLLSFEGSVCLYQAEELGQTETDILWEELTDPPGFAFWPDYKGRDGCRTPMVWDGSPEGGFTTGIPWLPVKPPQLARNVASQAGIEGSVLETYRTMLAFRRDNRTLRDGKTSFFTTPDPILAFRRATETAALACVFNLSPEPQVLPFSGGTLTGPSQNASLEGKSLSLGPNGFAFLAPTGTIGALGPLA
ncbi:MAG: alpha-glucosidase [Cereibacter sphaeroides]|uniref:Alpha-glucosidase n=1 Tax=Cereibacter sphaeroides TaxID=1063 RepID=A0A2W5SKS3_CERSP|nr:MAG: alpha-glucosidase [Cereibacter sphaeroides]